MSRAPSELRVAEIDVSAIAHNVATMARTVAPAEVIAVVKADGYGHGAATAARAALAGGATMLGVAEPGAMVTVPAAALRREKVLTGSSMGSNHFKLDMPRLVELYFQGKLMLDEMITNRFPLSEVNTAFETLRDGHVMRSVLTYD